MQRWVSSRQWAAMLKGYQEMDLAARVREIERWHQESEAYREMVNRQRAEVKELIEAFPPWRFYCARGNPQFVRRVLGVVDHERKGPRLKVVTGHVGFNNMVLGGCTPDDLVMMPLEDGWTREQLLCIRWTPTPSAYLFPLEYYQLMEE